MSICYGKESGQPQSSRLAQLPWFNAPLAGGVKNSVRLCRERFSLLFEFSHLLVDRLRAVSFVQLHAARAGRLALTEIRQVNDLFFDAGQLGLQGRELLSEAGDLRRIGRLRGSDLAGGIVLCIAD